MTQCEGGESLAAASSNGSVFVLRLEAASAKTCVQQVRQLNMQDDGCAVDINYLDSGRNCFYYVLCVGIFFNDRLAIRVGLCNDVWVVGGLGLTQAGHCMEAGQRFEAWCDHELLR